jgi:dTDP-4-dehydrorhamnose 3,5-epimerase
MQLISTPISDLFVIQPNVFEDSRGYFFESYNSSVFKQHNIHAEFVQDNQSLSQKNVLRGLHFQHPP